MSEAQPRPLPPSLQANPHLDDWIRIEKDGTVTVRTGKVELGQGIRTAIALIAAEELDVALDRKPDPTGAEIREALAPNLCRCGAHSRVLRAVARAARERGAADVHVQVKEKRP